MFCVLHSAYIMAPAPDPGSEPQGCGGKENLRPGLQSYLLVRSSWLSQFHFDLATRGGIRSCCD